VSEVLEQLLKDLNERMEAVGASVEETRLRQIVTDQFNALADDKEFVRKMRFGGGEQKLVGTKFARWGLGVADIEFLYDLMEKQQGVRNHPGPSEELRNTFKALSEAVYLPMEQVREIDKKAIDDLFPRIPLAAFHGYDRVLASKGAWQDTQAYQAAVRAMDTAESGYGSQLIGTQYVGELWEGARKDSRIFGLIEPFEMTAPVAYLPVEADLPELLFVSENTSATASDYTTTKTGSNRVSVTAYKFILHQMWSGEMEEDSIVPYIPFLRRQAAKSLAHYSDSLVLNGDTTNAGTGNINLDDADPADTKHYLAFDGVRHAALVDNTANAVNHGGITITLDALLSLRKKMLDTSYLMDWGHPTDSSDLVYIADPDTVEEICQIDEVKTVDQIGSRATVLTGQQAQIAQHSLISSMAMSKTEADGKVSTTAGNNTLGQVAAFNRRGYTVGWRRRVMVETERLPGRDQTRLIYSLRMGLGRFTPTGAASGQEHTAVLYNIAVA